MVTRRAPAPRKVPTVRELPVTRAMLYGVRDELAARLDAHTARFAQVDARFVQLDARLDQTNARIDQTNARLDQTNARIDQLRSDVMGEVHRVGVLVEEQEIRNRIVLEVVQGHQARFERLEAGIARVEASIDELRELVYAVVRAVTPQRS